MIDSWTLQPVFIITNLFIHTSEDLTAQSHKVFKIGEIKRLLDIQDLLMKCVFAECWR